MADEVFLKWKAATRSCKSKMLLAKLAAFLNLSFPFDKHSQLGPSKLTSQCIQVDPSQTENSK